MNHDDDVTQSLLDQSDNEDGKSVQIGAPHIRHWREPVKMTSTRLMQFLLVLAILVTFVYAVQAAISEHFQEQSKNKYTGNQSNPLWTYDCSNKICERRLLKNGETPVSVEECSMSCNQPSIWPKPKSLTVKEHSLSTFTKNQIAVKIDSPNKLVEEDLKLAIDLFMVNLPTAERVWLEDVDLLNFFMNIKVTSKETKIKIATDESYKLTVNKIGNNVVANITAYTYFGARHGLETLSQLIILDSFSKKLQIYHDVEIQDSPAFPHRGLMVDTARNFFPIEQLLRVIDGMAMNKMNVFHLHLTDSVSFPIALPSNPWLGEYGAYDPDMVYSPENIKGLVEYARIRGIRVILEIDAPSHANEGWNHLNTDSEKLIICGEKDVFNGHLNPDNNNTFKLLESVYSDLLKLGTDDETFHIGGDEVNLDCLAQTNSSKSFNNLNEFWASYVNKIFKTVSSAFNGTAPENLVIWSSPLTDWHLYLLKYSRNLVVQYWYGKLEPILHNGNKIIFSTVGKWYLDCGFGSWKPSGTNGVCDPYTPWQTFYNYRPWKNYASFKNQVLGGEACLWTEQVGVDTLESRIWPRTAALAERLWSDLPQLDLYDVSTRFTDQRDRLIRRGLKVSTVWPRWCSLHPGKCK